MTRDPREIGPAATGVSLFVFGVFGFVFAGIGLSVLIWMWTAPFDGFGSPPLIFRIFASFISLAFIAMGGGTLYGAILGGRRLGREGGRSEPTSESAGTSARSAAQATSYACPGCGALLADKSDVSPLGDVKCPFCNRWFNIHQASPRV